MKYLNIKDYSDESFRRITGVKMHTFNKMIEILNATYIAEHSHNVRKSGSKFKLSMEDRLLVTLEYLREYRPFIHIAASYGVHESTQSNGWKIHLLKMAHLVYLVRKHYSSLISSMRLS